MKLLISLSYYSPHISGLTLCVRNLAELMSENGYDVSVLCVQHERQLALKEKMHGVTVFRVPYLFRLSKGFIMFGFFMTAIRLLKDTDAVLITLPQAEGALVALVAKF